MKYIHLCTLLLMLVFCNACGQGQPKGTVVATETEAEGVTSPYGPKEITRNIIQDRKGNIWMASWQGIFKYDGKAFTNMTSKITSARFFSLLEDSKGNFWFGTVGAGVYYYDGKSLRLFTNKDGGLGDGAGSIYEDKKGNIWFGLANGVSRYDGQSFRNYILDGDTLYEVGTRENGPKKHAFGVGPIIEDKKGGFWFGTDGVIRYDGKSFRPFTHNGQPFKNVRSIIEDKSGNIWIGGADGLWRYDGHKITNLMQGFVGHIMEDRNGNIWTSAGRNSYQGWALSRYDAKSLSEPIPTATTIANKEMSFGILEDDKGNIWFGDFHGVHRYDGKIITDFNDTADQQ